MERKNDTPQKTAMRERMKGDSKQNDIKIKAGADVNHLLGVPFLRNILLSLRLFYQGTCYLAFFVMKLNFRIEKQFFSL